MLTTRSEYDRLGRLHRRWDYDYCNNLVPEEQDDNPLAGIAGSTTSPGVCWFRMVRCLARRNGAGMPPVTYSKILLSRSLIIARRNWVDSQLASQSLPQSVPVLRPGLRAVYAAGPDRVGGGVNLYQYALGWVDPWGLSKCKAPNGYKIGDVDPHGTLSPGVNRASGHTNSKNDGFLQSHHPI